MGRAFPGAQVGLRIGLTPAQAALDDVLKLSRIIRGAGLAREIEMGFDHIMHVPQQGGGPLHDVLVAADAGSALAVGLRHQRAGQHLGLDLVAPEIGKTDGIQDVDPVHPPHQARVPVDAFQHSPGGAGGGHAVAIPFCLQFRHGKAGVVSPDLHFYRQSSHLRIDRLL